DQTLLVAGLELVSVPRQSFEVANPVVARARPKEITKSERTQRRIATGTATRNGEPLTVYFTALNQKANAVDTVVYVHDPPLTLEPLTIGTPIPSAPTIIDVEHGDTTAGPVLDSQI